VLEDGHLAGIVTERDLVRGRRRRRGPDRHRRGQVRQPAPAGPEKEADEVARRMLDLGVWHLPVGEHRKIVGMISMRDLLVLQVWPSAEIERS